MKAKPKTLQRRCPPVPSLRDRLLASTLVVLFVWTYTLWLPFHLASEPHDEVSAFAPHSHRSHDGHAAHETRGATDHDSLAEEEAPTFHEHLLLEAVSASSASTAQPVVLAGAEATLVESPDTAGRPVPASLHGPPRQPRHSPLSPRAPPCGRSLL